MKKTAGLVAILLLASTARAALAPEEIVILAAASDPYSRELAVYYADVRGIPRSNIFRLEVRPGTDLPRATWEQMTRPAILDWLRKTGLETKVRCAVIAWNVPLRISGRPKDLPEMVARRENLKKARQAVLDQFAGLLKTVDALGSPDKPTERAPPDPKVSPPALAKDLEAALQKAQGRVQRLEGPARKQAEAALEQAFVAGAGGGGLMALIASQRAAVKMPEEIARKLEALRAQLALLDKEFRELSLQADTVARDEQILRRLGQLRGLIGVLQWINEQERLLERSETQASFDSELSLLFWPDYPLQMWQPNPLHYAMHSMPDPRRTLMVSRLAAPTPKLAKELIDTSLAVEKTGLSGKVYIDARGMAYDPKRDRGGGYAQYDQSLRDLADRLRKHTKLEVVLDNKPELFQPGQCPNAALYCGWYSLAKYVDAFTWVPGAVGYHIASSEAVDLFASGSKLWCPAMLERGVVATLGPTFEPYLSAFPLPDDFFPLLLTGRYTLVETYYRTSPFCSWAMVLVGDPLYNPFKNHPALDESALPERLKTAEPPRRGDSKREKTSQ